MDTASTIIARPTVEIVAGEIDRVATAAEAALLASGLPVFQRGTKLVAPITSEVPAAHGRMTRAAGLKDIEAAALVDLLARSARFERYDVRKKGLVPCDPPERVARIILARSGEWTLPPMAGVVTTPTIRPDGSLLTDAGYDPATRLYHALDPDLKLPPLPAKPSGKDAERAIKLLDGLLDEFPFVAPVDRAVALAALITPVCRGIIPLAPLTALKASTAGTGKSFLVDLAAAIATGRPCPVLSAADRSEETEKRLAGVLLAGYPIVSLDNVNGDLGGDLLCQAVERPVVRLRALGGSDITEVECRATYFATGNGLRIRGDMTRRTLLCTLDANVERPELRQFRDDPVRRVLDDRGTYVAAALTVVRAYITAGQPGRIKPALASFPAWSDNVRSALVWLGQPDPVATMETAREGDPELAELRQVIGAWHREQADKPCAIRDIVHEPGEELRDALTPIAGERGGFNTRRLGHWLSRYEGRIIRFKPTEKAQPVSLRLKKNGVVGGVAFWKVEEVV